MLNEVNSPSERMDNTHRPKFDIDDKSGMVSGYCTIPWYNIELTNDGNIYNCNCMGKVKLAIGNILDVNTAHEFLTLLNNNVFKDSILDGSYRYCRALVCSPLENNMLKIKELDFVESITDLNKFKSQPLNISLNIDNSCNLKCPSCRNDIIIHKNNKEYMMTKRILEQLGSVILPALDYRAEITLSSGGELFASPAFMEWIFNFDLTLHPNIKFIFMTNATLLAKNEAFLRKIEKNISAFYISIDAATEETYLKTRINGKWDDLLKGLELVKDLYKNNIDLERKSLFHYCISSLNFHEINAFVEFAKAYGNGKVSFQRIERWGQTDQQWQAMNVFAPTHTKYNDLLDEVRNFDFDNKLVISNLHYLRNSL